MCDADIEGIPIGNLRVPRADFADVWRAAEQLSRTDAYAAAVALTCRWIACATVVFNGRPGPSYAPITRTSRRAHEELLEREYLAAEEESIRVARSDDPDRAFVEGATDTLRWAWRGQGRFPLGELRPAKTSCGGSARQSLPVPDRAGGAAQL